MQPPPQTVLPGTGGPPPPVGMGPNPYWRNNPYSKRANVQVSGAAAAVQPVTDPFAFGRLTPQNTPLNTPSKANTLVRPGASLPAFSQPTATNPAYAGDFSHGVYTSSSGSEAGLLGGYTSTTGPSPGSHAGYMSSSGSGLGSHGGYMSSSASGPSSHGGYTSSSASGSGSHRGYTSSSGSGPGSHGGYTSSSGSGTGSDGMYASSSASGTGSHELYTTSGSSAPPAANPPTYTNATASLGLTGYFSNSTVVNPSAEPPPRNSSTPSPYNLPPGLGNTFGEHQNRPKSTQDNRDFSTSHSVVTNATSFHPHPVPHTAAQWRPVQDGVQPSVSNYLPPAVLPSQSVSSSVPHSLYSFLSSGSSHLPTQTHNLPQPRPSQQSTPPTPLAVGAERNTISVSQSSSVQFNHSFQPDYTHHQNVGLNNSFSSQPYTEHFYPQPVLPESNRVNSIASLQNPQNYLHESETASGHNPTGSGTISMFFKGDEAENEEILSSERQGEHLRSDSDSASQQSSVRAYVSTLQSQPYAANVPSQTPVSISSTNETAQMGIEQYFSLSVSNQDDYQSSRPPDVYASDKVSDGDAHAGSGPQYDNVENLECVQNQEVLPSEPLDANPLSPSTSCDIFRYVPLPGPSIPKNDIVCHAEGGPNLETPDSVPHPVRSDSVSSGYSNVSHRSASSSTKPQELTGTFIQQESGKPDESPASFFKQIDSSPMSGDSTEQSMAKNSVHGSLSQAPTPSPPKPTGIFQTSANSSFEPVRSHGVGVKPVEVDQAKMVGEVRENHAIQSKTKLSTTMPATSPGNLEQPPDNLETIFISQAHPFANLEIGDPGNLLQPLRGPSLESVPLALDKRPSSRAHGASKKCESPATTLWAQNELPIFGANVLLAPAAPAVHVHPKPQTKEVIQPPEVGLLDLKPNKTGLVSEQTSPEGNISSENLENPPKMGAEEPLHSQASSGYASLLSSPPTESLQNQPLLIAQPNQSYNFSQPINFSMSLPNQINYHIINQPLKVDDESVSTSHIPHGGGIAKESALSLLQGGSLINPSLSTNLLNTNLLSSTSLFSQPSSNIASDLIQPPSQQNPLNLATSSQPKIKEEHFLPESSTKLQVTSSIGTRTNPSEGSATVILTSPVSHMAGPSNNSANQSSIREEASGALDFTMSRVANNHSANNLMKVQNQSLAGEPVFPPQAFQTEAEINDKQSFYRQVTKDVQQQSTFSAEIKEAFHSVPQIIPSSQLPRSALSEQPKAPSQQLPGSKNEPDSMQKEIQMHSNQHPPVGPPAASASEPPAGYDPAYPAVQRQSSSAPATSVGTRDSTMQQEQQRPPSSQTPQQGFGPPVDPSAYFYYRNPYDLYPSAYPSAYPAQDPRAAYPAQDPRAAYPAQDPRAAYPAQDPRAAYPAQDPRAAYPAQDPRAAYPAQDPRGAYPAPDPRAAQLYYPDAYGAYDPRYRPYDTSAAYVDPGRYRYVEPERPSSRCSQTSDRPSSRQGYGEEYVNPKAGWSAPNEYYGYYPSQYDYGDPSRWDPYHPAYDPRSRDPRRYWYDTEQGPYHRGEAYTYANRQGGSEDPWQYDPRFDSSFDNEPVPSRVVYGDDFDRRSVHSEHSVHSLHSSRSVHSRRSSFSSQSQHSQVYRSQPDLTANTYNAPAQPASLHHDYTYGLYSGNFDNQQAVPDYYDYPAETGWQPVEQVPSRPSTPEKFSVPHVCARFGPGGHFLKVLPNLPSEGQPALVEVHSMETMLQHTKEQEEMRAFPGPLLKEETHKVDVINFAQNKATECFRNDNLLDQESAILLWDFIVLLCRQNGTVVGTDIAELLLQDHKTVWLPGKSPNEANLIDFSNEPVEQAEESGASQLSFLTDLTSGTSNSLEKETERFRELLLYGRKKDALESAMKHGLWGHALLLASKMDSRTHARVMTRFANSLPINDPLQTVYQLMSGRMPAASTCCGDEKWGDWRPHLAMVLSNLTNNLDVETRTITTMGDTLASRGLLDASHFCYLMAQIGFGVYTKKTTKLVLIGSNHSLPFLKFSSNEAIHRTEAYEYAQSLGTQPCSLPNFQVFKFVYACRLTEVGLAAQAFHYCEVIAKTILKHPSYYSAVLISQLIEISSQLRFFDPQLKEKPEQELFIEPIWLVRLRHLDGEIKQGAIVCNSDRATPLQYACSTPSSELDHVSQSDSTGVAREMGPGTENPLLATLMPNMMPPVQAVQLVLPDSQAILERRPPPPLQQPPVSNEPSYPTSPSFLPGTSFGPSVPNQGYVPTYVTEQTHTYPGSSAEPVFPSSPGGESVTELQWNQDPGMRRCSQDSPTKKTFNETALDYNGSTGKMVFGQRSRSTSQSSTRMVPGQRSRTTSQSSARMGYGGRSRTTSESSNHSMGSGRRNSAAKQPSPPPIPEVDGSPRQGPRKELKTEPSSRKSGRSWFPLKIGWLMGKGKNEAHLPDDTNRSIVWDEKKQRWVNMDEPEEESKPPPPPPPGMPKGSQSISARPGGPPNSSVNMFSIRAAGARGRYVDVLNPSGTRSGSSIPPPADLFAPLAPMAIPANLFVPNAVPQQHHPAEGSGAEQVTATEQTSTDHSTETQFSDSAQIPPGYELPASNLDESPSGELSRSSSMSSLSREVSQHLNQSSNNPAALGAPPTGAVQFYNPSQFAQPSAAAGGSKLGRFGQRKYPTLK